MSIQAPGEQTHDFTKKYSKKKYRKFKLNYSTGLLPVGGRLLVAERSGVEKGRRRDTEYEEEGQPVLAAKPAAVNI